jgi:hypothetical protein
VYAVFSLLSESEDALLWSEVRAGIAKWISRGGDFIEVDVIDWKEVAWLERRRIRVSVIAWFR